MTTLRNPSLDLAVTGMSGRFSGAASIDALWTAVLDGQVLTTTPTAGPTLDTVAAGGFVPDTERFDHRFFGISQREAGLMDPQHRALLECAWATLEDSGHVPANNDSIGVYAAVSRSAHLRRMLIAADHDSQDIEDLLLANERDYVATRIAYRLGLTGPALTVLTACSSSLVAVHLAGQALINEECDRALVVAASLRTPGETYATIDGGIMSPTGRCRPFDAGANGTVPGSGVIGLLLRRRRDAEADSDPIAALILGTAINNDGANRAGYTAPAQHGQMAVIASALGYADVTADTLGYLETHGTGTPVGDPIEWAAATEVLRQNNAEPAQVAIGTLKATIGHLDAAAGLAGLAKAVCVVRHGLIPPVTGFNQANPLLEVCGSPLWVPRETSAWVPAGPRRAGISSFGVGGTNAHVIIEEAPKPVPRKPAADLPYLVTVSARDTTALETGAARLADHLIATLPRLDDVAHTLAVGRRTFKHRVAVVANTPADAAQALRDARHSELSDGPAPLALLLPGQGNRWAAGGAALLPGFDDELNRVLGAFDPALAGQIRSVFARHGEQESPDTAIAQPALFSYAYALAKTLDHLGLHAVAYVGHSVGEIAAAALCGVLDLEAAAALVTARGRFMAAMPAGAMITVRIGAEQARDLLSVHPDLDLAAVNAADACVLSGPVAAVDALAATLGPGAAQRLHTAHAFHSRAMDTAADALDRFTTGLTTHRARVAMALGADGTILAAGESLPPSYFARQVRQPVRFRDCIIALQAAFGAVYCVEGGPGRSLSVLAESAGLRATPLSDGSAGIAGPLRALAELWTAGQPVDIGALGGNTGRRMSLPTYAFGGEILTTPDSDTSTAQTQTSPMALPYESPTESTTPHEVVRAVWSRVLGDSEMEDDADFFDLGGDSLTATRLARQLGEAIGIVVPVADVLRTTTLRAQQALITALMADAEPAPAQASRPADSPVTPAAPRALSRGQYSMWLAHKLDPTMEGALHVPLALHFDGPLDPDTVQRALDAAMARHDALRTRFTPGTAITQTADLPARWPLAIDPTLADAAGLDELLQAHTTAPFDLVSGPPVRAVLFGDGDHHVLLMVLHHLVCDGWSLRLLVDELLRDLAARSDNGTPAPLPFSAYLDWERSTDGSATLKQDLAHWLDRHVGSGPPLPLPAARAFSNTPTATTIETPVNLSPSIKLLVNRVARSLGVAPHAVWIAALATAWSALAGSGTAHIAVPAANRTQRFEGTVGAFVNALPLPVDVSSSRHFADVARDVGTLLLEGSAHGSIAIADVYSGLASASKRLPVAMCTVYSEVAPCQLTNNLSAAAHSVRIVGGQFPLNLLVAADATGAITARVAGSTDLYGAAEIGCVSRAIEVVLGTCLHDPSVRISDAAAPLMPGHTRCVVREDGGPTRTVGTAVAAFRARVMESPESTAIVDGAITHSYAELDRLATTIARGLHARGIRRGDAVGLVMPNGPAYIATVLGLWRIGAVAVPRPITDPDERTAQALSDVGARLCVRTGSRAVASGGEPVVEFSALISDEGGSPNLPEADPDDIAYIVFTSGSSGKPKPVAITHRSLANNLGWRLAEIGLNPDDRILHSIPIAFDPAFWQSFGPLAAGASVLFADLDLGADPDSLARAARTLRATVLDVVPPVLAAWSDESLAQLPARVVFCGGEALPASLVNRFNRLCGADLYNQYGPSEACIDATSYRCQSTDAPVAAVPIGRPIAGARVYVLDDEGARCPVGVPGEIHVGGVGVAVGYLGNPELTAQKFLRDPYATAPGARMYRTGDQGRWLADGALEFLGRLDNQVKIHGNRIEVEEIEAVLRSLAPVQDAAVTVVGETRQRLVAYVTVYSDANSADLRERTARHLPQAMVPDEIHLTSDLPRGTNGKLDRAAVAHMAATESDLDRSVATPVGLEALVARVFATVLEIPAIGVDDDLYTLGGASLGAARIAGELTATLGREVAARTVLDYPVVGRLAAHLATADAGSASARFPATATIARSFEQEYQLRIERAAGGPAAPILESFTLPRPVTDAELATAAKRIVRRHDALAPLTPPSAAEALPASTADLAADDTPILDASSGLDVRLLGSRGPTAGQALIRLARNRADATSARIVSEEIQAALQGEALAPAPSYSVYAAERHAEAQGRNAALVSYWTDILGSDVGDLFESRRPLGSRTWRGRSVPLDVQPSNSTHILPIAPYVRAFGSVLAEFTGRSRLLIAVPVSHRTRTDRTMLVGRCVDLMPVSYAHGRSTARTIHDEIAASLDQAVLPYLALVDLFDAGDLRRRPRLTQVGVNMHPASDKPDMTTPAGAEHWLDLDLLLHIQPAAGSVRLALSGAIELFNTNELTELLTNLGSEITGLEGDLAGDRNDPDEAIHSREKHAPRGRPTSG